MQVIKFKIITSLFYQYNQLYQLLSFLMTKEKVKEALILAGNQHLYQKLLTLLIGLCWIQINFVLLGSTLIYMDPVFNCQSTGDKRIYQQQACQNIGECVLIDQFTITSHLQLYCQREWARDIIQSIFSLGSFTGLIVMNMISDTQGRKISTVISLTLCLVGVLFCFLGANFSIIGFLIIAQFCGGFGAYAIVTLSYTLLSDFCSDTFRPKAIVFVNSAWGISTLTMGIVYLLKLDWFYFLLYVTIIPLILVSGFTYKFLLQSPYILMSQKKRQKALQVLIHIAKTNKREQNIPQIRLIIENQQGADQIKKPSLKNVLKVIKKWQYLKPIIVLTVIYGIGNLNFYGVSYSFEMEGLGFGYNCLIGGCVQIFSFVYLNFMVNILPRKKGIPGFYTLCMMVGLLFLVPSIAENYIVGTLLLGLSRAFSTIAYTLIACMQVQAFTVQIQSSAAGVIQAFSLYGALLAPIIVDMSDKLNMNPIVMISLWINFAIWPTIFLKQTLIKENKQDQKIKNPLLKDYQDNNPEEIINSKQKSRINSRFESQQSIITVQDGYQKHENNGSANND